MHILPVAIKLALVQHTNKAPADIVTELSARIMANGQVRVHLCGVLEEGTVNYVITKHDIKMHTRPVYTLHPDHEAVQANRVVK